MLVQVAPLRHGEGDPPHSFTSDEHVGPDHAGGHAHENELRWSVQRPPFWQGLLAHSLVSTAQVSPEYPGAHAHVNTEFEMVVHVAPLEQGVARHRLANWQVVPLNDTVHAHANEFTRSMHVPPFSQGPLAQSS